MNVSKFKCLKMSCALLLFLAVICQGCATASRGMEREMLGEVEGPHVVWAKPLAGGPIRALFIAPDFSLFDVAAINTRLDMVYEIIPLWDAHHPGYDPTVVTHPPDGASGEEVLARLKAALKKNWDVIVLANLHTDALPEPVLSDILGHVARGAGLVTAHLRDRDDASFKAVLQALQPDEETTPVWNGIGECAFPGRLGLEGIAAMLRHEKGRVVMLDYPGDTPGNHCLIQLPSDPIDMDPAYEDNAYSLVIRALCTASGRVNPVRIQSVEDAAPSGPDDMEIPPDFYPEFVQAMRDSVVSQPSRPFRLTLDKPADQRYDIHAQLRKVDSATQIIYRDPVPLERGEDSHLFEIPAGTGAYMLDVWLQTRSGVADWYTAQITIPGWPEFHNLKLDKYWLLPNDSLEITLEVRPVASQHRQGTIYTRARDAYGRDVAYALQPFSSQGGTFSFRIHFSDLLSSLVKLEIFALENASASPSEWELHSAFREVRYLSVRRPPGPTTLELVASVEGPREYAQLHFLDTLADTGITVLHAPGGEAAIVAAARARLGFLPALTRVSAERARDGLYRDPCLNDPEYRSGMELSLREGTLKHWAGALTRYSLGNRNYLCASEENVCQCGHCLGAFQEWLQREYTDLNALNNAWETNFGDWDFIELPLSLGPGHEGPGAPWIDFRVFMDDQFSEFHGWARSQVAAADAAGQAGARFTSETNPYNGYHWPGLFQSLDFVAAEYTPLFLEKMLSYSKPNSWSGVVLPDTADASLLSWLPWQLALNQVPALWIGSPWAAAADATSTPWVFADSSPSPALSELAQTVSLIRDTAGPLLYTAQKATPKTAVYDSHPSRYLCDVNGEYPLTLYQVQEAAARLLRLTSHDFQFISKTGLPMLTPQRFPVLVLPFCRALDEEERAALRAYVEGGGALIADVIPGAFDAHGIPVQENGMQTIFGVKTGEAPLIKNTALAVSGVDSPETRDAGWILVDTAVNLQGGVALAQAGDAPAWIVNRHGAGHTLLLNHPFREIQQDKDRRLVPAEWEAMATFLAGLPNLPQPVKPEGEAFLGRIYAYTLGNARIYAAQADSDAPRQDIRLPLDAKDSVYDVLTGEPIRRPHRHRFRLEPGAVQIVSCLPYSVEELILEAPDVATAGQRLPLRVLVKSDAEKAGKHVFLLDFSPQNKAPLPWYRQVADTDIGYAEINLPLARNEIPGRYMLRVRDAVTGMEISKYIKIASPTD